MQNSSFDHRRRKEGGEEEEGEGEGMNGTAYRQRSKERDETQLSNKLNWKIRSQTTVTQSQLTNSFINYDSAEP